MRAAAFCPGHITGFFYPCEHDDPLASGSRGAGVCVHLGAVSEVRLTPGRGDVTIWLNDQREEAPVTLAAARELLPADLDAEVRTRLELPVSSGFGMSAAGALSAATALAHLLDLPMQRAYEAAHRAEIANRCGLGDVSALTRGGVTFRVREGLPPHGQVERLADDLELVAGVVGGGMRTSSVLGSAGGRRKLAEAGKACHRELLEAPTVDNFLRLSRRFAEESGIMTAPVREALKALDGLGPASMIMLGNAVFATGALDEQEEVLKGIGPTFRLRADVEGPRLIRKE